VNPLMPIRVPESISAAACSALITRCERLEFRMREVAVGQVA